LGVRFAAELWAEPTRTTLAAADASLSSIGTNYSARAAFGWKLFDRFYAGPETQVYGGDGYKQTRFGAVLWRKRHRLTQRWQSGGRRRHWTKNS
jgi:hypothetical protein